ncbi:MAG: MotA/TolQ/ExbB proton channel family protein [Verrucomicrobiia bacterium]
MFPLFLPLAEVNRLQYAFQASTFEGKMVIIFLLIGSIFSWSVMVAKLLEVRRAHRSNTQFLKDFRRDPNPLTLFSKPFHYLGSPLFQIFRAGCRELAFQKTGSTEVDDTFIDRIQSTHKISTTAMNSVKSAMERAVGESALKLEDKMVLLATAVSGAPFLGLLGTVWGVMDTFTGVAMAGSANLAAMAPGVSGALTTTVTGLLVAIPAMFGYNYLVSTIRALTVGMDNFAGELAAALEHHYLEIRS